VFVALEIEGRERLAAAFGYLPIQPEQHNAKPTLVLISLPARVLRLNWRELLFGEAREPTAALSCFSIGVAGKIGPEADG